LKPADGMASFAERIASARAMAHRSGIHVTNLERRLGPCYSADLLSKLVTRFPSSYRCVWLMGADNLARHDSQWKPNVRIRTLAAGECQLGA
jgi:nicotinate-nucleotide adenylyltransferase